jgi:hypothetical protein
MSGFNSRHARKKETASIQGHWIRNAPMFVVTAVLRHHRFLVNLTKRPFQDMCLHPCPSTGKHINKEHAVC